ncbi:hypothetical protein GH5_00635 [Leishmania sp. Ghana 2012 LV757]|uniref:hypothetical protein n=1 Tax=Leishmania sp. Ghana 2012 LV757 TaxID=2803181 RepID=UPI001B3F0F5B|nr:hypothetical protein GH5_00635 [Leishmania sp. Ghana 2012 LV757]
MAASVSTAVPFAPLGMPQSASCAVSGAASVSLKLPQASATPCAGGPATEISVLESLANLFSCRNVRAPSEHVALPPPARGTGNTDALENHADECDYVVETLAAAPYSLLSDALSSSSVSLLPRLTNAAASWTMQTSSPKRHVPASAVSLLEESPPQPSCAAELASLINILSVLSAVLQRSPRAHQHSRNFARLLALLTDGRFTATAAEQVRTLWLRCSGHASDVGARAGEEVALSLYCDILLLVAYHAKIADPSVKVSSSLVATDEVLASLYAVNTDMGAELVRATAHRPGYLRQSVASLTAFCILQAAHLSVKVLEDALRNLEVDSAAQANMAHMAFMAALPVACPQMTPAWQCRALEVVRKATLYDAAADVASCVDGIGAVPVIQRISMWAQGYATQGLLSIMSEAAWCYCTSDALLHISRAVSVYGVTWTTYSESYMNLVSFLHRALSRYERLHAQEGSIALRLLESCSPKATLAGSSTVIPRSDRHGNGRTTRTAESSIESLIRRAVLGAAGTSSDAALAERQQPQSRGTSSASHLCGSYAEGDGLLDDTDETPESFLAWCEAQPHSPRNFIFYLSLLAYVTSALPSLLGSLEELHLFFYLPRFDRAAAIENNPAHARVAETAEPPSAACGKGRQLFALCMDLLRTSLSSALAHSSDDRSSQDRQRCLLCESTTTLLCAFMCRFPHSLQELELETGASHLVSLVSQVVTTIMKAPNPSLRMKRLAYSLLQRYASGVDCIADVMVQLLASTHWTALTSDDEYVETDLRCCVQLYQHLCRATYELYPAEPGRLVSLLAELPAGAFSNSSDGAATATTLVHTIFSLMEDDVDDAALLGRVPVPQLPQLIDRLGEALDTLTRAYATGFWLAGGQSTWCSVCAAASLLYKVVLLYHVPALVATAVVPVSCRVRGGGSGGSVVTEAFGSGGSRRLRSVAHVLLQLLCEDSLAPIHHAVAELLVASLHATALHRTSDSMLQMLRTNLSPCEVVAVAQRVLQVQRESLGSPSNVMRLEVVQAMVKWCPALFLFVFGPEKRDVGEDSGGFGPPLTEPADLPLMQLLMATVRSAKAALYEKSLALNILRFSGMTRLVPMQDIVSLVPREENDARTLGTLRQGCEWEEATLVVACVAYANARVAQELSNTKAAGSPVENGAGSGGDGVVDSSNKATASTRESTNALPAPQRRSIQGPLSPFGTTAARPLQVVRSKVVSAHTDAMDQLLRRGAAALQRVRAVYDADRREVDFDDQTNWLVRQATGMTVGDNADVSASVVFPRRGAEIMSRRLASSHRCDSIQTPLHEATQGSILSRCAVPTALPATSGARATGEPRNTTTFLHSLRDDDTEVAAASRRLYPVGTAATRFFSGTGDDRRLNNLAAQLDTMADLAKMLEQLLWLSGVDTCTAGLFGKRTQQLLECSVEAVLSCEPGPPLLAPLVTRQVQQQLRLAKAAASILESAFVGDVAELPDMCPAVQNLLRRLVAFVKVNCRHTFVLVDALPVVTAFPPATFAAYTATEELMAMVQAAMHTMLQQTTWTPETVRVLDRLVSGCTRVFSRPRSEGVSDATLVSRLLPTLLQLASRLARLVQPTQPINADALRFVRALECVNCVIAHSGGQTAGMGFVDKDVLLGFLQALGQFSASSVYDSAAQRHWRLGWNACWLALLSLWCTIMSVRGQYNAVGSGWAPPLKAALLSTPRFAAALSAFAGVHGADRRGLLLWEVEEVDACTRLAAVLAAQNVILEKLTPCVQAGFLFLRQPHFQQHCVPSLPSADAAISEGKRITVTQAHVLRNELTILLKQSSYAVPRDGATLAAFVFPLELLGQTAETAGALNRTECAGAAASSATSLVYSLDLLRQLTVRELQVLRRVTAETASGGGGGGIDRSPNVGLVSCASRESSVTRSPSRGPLAGDADTATDVDDSFTVDGQVDVARDVLSVHLETVQLALTAYALTVQDFIQNASTAPGASYTAAVVQGVQHSTERLIRTLRSLVKDLADVRWPLLSRVVRVQTARLQHLIESL